MTESALTQCRPSWLNWSRTQRICPQYVAKPRSLPELRELMRQVEARGGQLKPVATGLSFSDILQTEDTLVETTSLVGGRAEDVLLPREEELWLEPHPPEPLVRIPCGARIRPLNAALAQLGLAFTNLGGYDNQTIVGAISTSTHGSGIGLPPLPDAVRSLDLLAVGGEYYRIEPTRGLTDPAKFKARYPERKLLQSDSSFWPCVVSLGCMGIITSVTMEVSRAFLLQETVRLRRWSVVKPRLQSRDAMPAVRNYEVLLNPYRRRDGDYDCLVTERNVAPAGAKPRPLPPARRSLESTTFLASTQRELLQLMERQPRLIPGLLRAGFEALETHGGPHIDESLVVYNVGKINTADVMSGEYFFPMANGQLVAAVEALLALVERNCRQGIYQPSPLALRFVRHSRAPLSMAFGEAHGAVEIACFSGLPYAAEALLSYEALCQEHRGRPHWGQMHELTGQPGWLQSAYPGPTSGCRPTSASIGPGCSTITLPIVWASASLESPHAGIDHSPRNVGSGCGCGHSLDGVERQRAGGGHGQDAGLPLPAWRRRRSQPARPVRGGRLLPRAAAHRDCAAWAWLRCRGATGGAICAAPLPGRLARFV
jgi:hypothetical protein